MRRYEKQFKGQNSKAVVRVCDGIEDFIAHAVPHAKDDASQRTDDYDWTRTRNFDEAVSLMRGGWHEGRDRIAELSDQITTAIGSPAQELALTSDVQGGAVDMGGFMAGEPECMMTWADQDGPHQIVHFTIDPGASGAVSSNSIIARGAIIAATIDALEAAGHRCAVDIVWSGTAQRPLQVWCPIKDAQDPLDIERLAFAVAHPSFTRRLMFAHLENDPARNQLGYNSGYGRPTELPMEARGEVYIPGMRGSSGDWTIEHSVNMALTWIKQAGVELDMD